LSRHYFSVPEPVFLFDGRCGRVGGFLIFLSPYVSFYFLYADESVLLVHQWITIYPRDQRLCILPPVQYIARYTQRFSRLWYRVTLISDQRDCFFFRILFVGLFLSYFDTSIVDKYYPLLKCSVILDQNKVI
jgi:hypothetical protein